METTQQPRPVQIGDIYASASGDTTYEVVSIDRSNVKTRIRCREFGWKVTNERAYFRTEHYAKQIQSGRWTRVTTVTL